MQKNVLEGFIQHCKLFSSLQVITKNKENVEVESKRYVKKIVDLENKLKDATTVSIQPFFS